MTIPEKAVQWAIQTANNQSHGYSQADRWGPDYDCSSFVITAYEQAGVPVREAGASYTGNMRSAFLKCGFVDVTQQCGISTGYGMQPGDVLLNYAAHTCIYVGNGKVANCRTDEGNPQHGDQSGNEIRVQSYWDGSPNRWNAILRYKVQTSGTTTAKDEDTATVTLPVTENHDWKPPMLKRSDSYYEVVKLAQSLLNVHAFDSGKADGYFGPKTEVAVNKARRFYGGEATSEIDEWLWNKLGIKTN